MKKQKGFTLLEIIIILAIIGTALPAILAAFGKIVATGADAASVAIATDLAEGKMEELIKGRRYVDIISSGPTDLTGSFSQYNSQIVVDYVDAADLDTSSASPPTNFKKVQVIITKDNKPNFNVTLSTVITNLGY